MQAKAQAALYKGMMGGGGPEKPVKVDAMTQRVFMGAPAFAHMASDYHNLYNAIHSKGDNPDPNSPTIANLAKQHALGVSDALRQYITSGDPESTQNAQGIQQQFSQVQKLDYAEQLRWLKAFEFVSQTTGSGRTPSPEQVKEIYMKTPSVLEPPQDFAAKMRTLIGQVSDKFEGAANSFEDQGAPKQAERYRARGKQYFGSIPKINGANYDADGNLYAPEIGVGGQPNNGRKPMQTKSGITFQEEP